MGEDLTEPQRPAQNMGLYWQSAQPQLDLSERSLQTAPRHCRERNVTLGVLRGITCIRIQQTMPI